MTSKVFEEKTARDKAYQYDGSAGRGGSSWRSDTFDYFVAKLPEAGPWLQWAEKQGPREITIGMLQDIKAGGHLMTELDPVVLSHLVWAFLHHCLTGAARQVFKNTTRQDGLNLWRQLTLEINSRTECVRHRLRNKCQQPPQAANNRQVWQCLANWESLYNEYLDAGGSFMDFEDRRGQILQILPRDLRRDLFRRLNEFNSIGAVNECLRGQLELEKDWSELDQANSKAKAVALMENDLVDTDDGEPEEHDMEALLALTSSSTTEEILAVQQRFKRFASRAGRQARPPARGGPAGRSGSKPGAARLPGTTGPTKCVNCGKTSHTTARCPEPKRDPKERPCFNCGKVGHMKSQCPSLSKPASLVTEPVVNFGRLEVDMEPSGGTMRTPMRPPGLQQESSQTYACRSAARRLCEGQRVHKSCEAGAKGRDVPARARRLCRQVGRKPAGGGPAR